MSSPRSLRVDVGGVRRAVRRWERSVDRPLPWRGERDPYRVLVSEVMLQQTQAARVAPAYEQFLDRFPDVGSLARASSADVLRQWGTLGYNRRAVNLRHAARAIVALDGFPTSVDELMVLPGVGPYTARAIASFAFGRDVGVVDANVRRVISRVYGADTNLQQRADALVPKGRSPMWNQAMIDLGALVCTARKPACHECPLTSACRWAAEARPEGKRYRAQPRFEETSRFVRGRIVAELRRSSRPVRVVTLKGVVAVDGSRFDAALISLERDGLVHRRRGSVALGATKV